MQQNAIDAYKPVSFTAKLLRDSGMSYAAIAKKLTENGFRTRQGKDFQAMTVKRILDRAAKAREIIQKVNYVT